MRFQWDDWGERNGWYLTVFYRLDGEEHVLICISQIECWLEGIGINPP